MAPSLSHFIIEFWIVYASLSARRLLEFDVPRKDKLPMNSRRDGESSRYGRFRA